MQLLIRFVVGGLVVSTFAVLADVLRPKGFAGLFAAAPSVALATLGLGVATQGAGYAALEARSMLAGEFAFIVYAFGCVYLMAVRRTRAAPAAVLMLVGWGAIALGIYSAVLR
jgi:uncharacterized membrane protein (GlpM family)